MRNVVVTEEELKLMLNIIEDWYQIAFVTKCAWKDVKNLEKSLRVCIVEEEPEGAE